jgi:hypothetical protein
LTISIKSPEEEIAYFERQKSNLKAADFVDYYAKEISSSMKTIAAILT